ncbi:hypothetical protein [Streptomyces sp. NPDC002671]
MAIAGLRRLLRDDELRWARPLALAYPALCILVLLGGGKPYYPLPLLLAVTAASCEPVVHAQGRAGHVDLSGKVTGQWPPSPGHLSLL